MGLLFALQPQYETSTPEVLHLKSHFRKFAMGGAFLFSMVFLGVMTLAAFPLFKLMYFEGGFWDLLIVGFFVVVLAAYPFIAGICFLFEENMFLGRRPDGLYDLRYYKQLALIKWARKDVSAFALDEIKESNWVGAINTAELKARAAGKKDKYGTKGHWLLVLEKDSPANAPLIIERRAKKDEITWLKFLIHKHFDHASP